MTGDNPRLLELRRRVQADPASIAFAQLAEECRRSGDNDDAVGICRAGLAHHPDYLSARVTLGRALLEIGRLDEAHAELTTVLNAAPDNLAANRALAEMYQKRGQMPEALTYYKRALQLAQHDEDLGHAVEQIENVVSPPPPPEPKLETAPTAIEDLFDFDTLLEQLGGRTTPAPEPKPIAAVPVASVLDAVELSQDDGDPFSVLERQLREAEAPPAIARAEPALHEPEILEPEYVEPQIAAPNEDDLRDQRVLAEFEDWLTAIAVDRHNQPSA